MNGISNSLDSLNVEAVTIHDFGSQSGPICPE